MKTWSVALAFLLAVLPAVGLLGAPLSRAPLRPLPQPSARPLPNGPTRFVDAARGDDANEGTREKPWRSIQHALRHVRAGDTICLRGGVYYENVYCAVVGTAEKPITLRSHPGELAVIDGGIPDFETDPAAAWVPAPDGIPGEYRSAKPWPNLRDVVGLFGDSFIGLQTYWERKDLQAENELWIKDEREFVQPLWCGPGLWYDKATGFLYARLAHTKLRLPASVGHELPRYEGETDPRKLPLVIAPFNAVALTVDQAAHLRFEDLVFRGGGYLTVKLTFGVDLAFDRCTIYCGTYGLSAKNTGPLKMTDCAVRGTMPPWAFREETGLYSYDGSVYPPFVGDGLARPEAGGKAKPAQVVRHLTRLTSHAILVTEGFYEHEVFAHPFNHDWEIARCEFTDGHDGVYLSGRNIRFHHNWVANMQDDGIYLSAPTSFVNNQVRVYQNLVSTVTSPLATHGRGGPGGDIFIYRNVVDQRGPIQYNRPRPDSPDGLISNGSLTFLTHGSPLQMENLFFYQNTCVVPVLSPAWFAGGMFALAPAGAARRVFNNLYLYYDSAERSERRDRKGSGYPLFSMNPKATADMQIDGNLHWHLTARENLPPDFFARLRAHPLSEASKKDSSAGWAAHSLSADPKLLRVELGRTTDNDYRLQPDSPALRAGIVLPASYEDPLRPAGNERPDIGALPGGTEPLRVGVGGRIVAGSAEGLGIPAP